MKLNITQEKLTRMLLSANPVLANCKGSKKAVRMFFNMLGMKCVVTDASDLSMFSTFTIYGTNNEIEQLSNNVILTLCANTYNLPDEYTEKQYFESSGGSTIYVTSPDVIDEQMGTKVHISSVGCNLDNAEIIDDVYYRNITLTFTKLADDMSNGECCKHIIDSCKCVPTIFAYNNNLPSLHHDDIDIKQAAVKDISPITQTNSLCIIITNVTDKELLPIKSILAKQLQEILPINIVVEADNIIGIAEDERILD